MDRPIPATLNAREAAALISVSAAQLTKLARAGFVERTGRGQYPSRALVTAALAYERNRQSSEAAKAAVDLRRARAAEIEQRRKRAAGDFISTANALALIDCVFGLLRADLEALPAVATRDLSLRKVLDDCITGILNRAADRLEARARALGGSATQSAVSRWTCANRL
jgi:hypothetical protein